MPPLSPMHPSPPIHPHWCGRHLQPIHYMQSSSANSPGGSLPVTPTYNINRCCLTNLSWITTRRLSDLQFLVEVHTFSLIDQCHHISGYKIYQTKSTIWLHVTPSPRVNQTSVSRYVTPTDAKTAELISSNFGS